MPYISQNERKYFDELVKLIHSDTLKNPGALNYLITQLVLAYLPEDPKYSTFNDAIGALECAKLELYRRLVLPYENKKMQENGDVF